MAGRAESQGGYKSGSPVPTNFGADVKPQPISALERWLTEGYENTCALPRPKTPPQEFTPPTPESVDATAAEILGELSAKPTAEPTPEQLSQYEEIATVIEASIGARRRTTSITPAEKDAIRLAGEQAKRQGENLEKDVRALSEKLTPEQTAGYQEIADAIERSIERRLKV
jgi:hypothetical protein